MRVEKQANSPQVEKEPRDSDILRNDCLSYVVLKLSEVPTQKKHMMRQAGWLTTGTSTLLHLTSFFHLLPPLSIPTLPHFVCLRSHIHRWIHPGLGMILPGGTQLKLLLLITFPSLPFLFITVHPPSTYIVLHWGGHSAKVVAQCSLTCSRDTQQPVQKQASAWYLVLNGLLPAKGHCSLLRPDCFQQEPC